MYEYAGKYRLLASLATRWKRHSDGHVCKHRLVLAMGLTVITFTREFKLHQASLGEGVPLYRFIQSIQVASEIQWICQEWMGCSGFWETNDERGL